MAMPMMQIGIMRVFVPHRVMAMPVNRRRPEFPGQTYSALPLITRFTQRARKNTGQRSTDAPPAAIIMPQIGPFSYVTQPKIGIPTAIKP